MPRPAAGVHYPRSLGDFQAWFRTDADCLDYLEWLRWPDGFVCSACEHQGVWRLGDGRLMCPDCGVRTSATAGTIFDRTRTPLTVWFTACWFFATQKDGISALALQKALGIGSYQTAWAMLHPYRAATKDRYTHERVVQPGTKASELLPGVHRIASLVQRWLLGTHQGAVNESHLSLYLDEFVFCFNRRHSRSRGMVFYRVLELAAGHDPVRYSELILNPRRNTTHRTPPATRGRPASLDRPPANRPWRDAPPLNSG